MQSGFFETTYAFFIQSTVLPTDSFGEGAMHDNGVKLNTDV
jgi:hypothetical protein